jgi:hypothetical protein
MNAIPNRRGLLLGALTAGAVHQMRNLRGASDALVNFDDERLIGPAE